ncbi:MAG: hypothetical protein WBQ23_13790 [Bacteroidota bacterium]
MGRLLILAILLINVSLLTAQERADTTAQNSAWRLEYRVTLGNSSVLDIEGYPQPKVGPVSQGGEFALGLEYMLGNDWSLYTGVHSPFRNGQAWANGQPFTMQESGLIIPVLFRTGHWNPLGVLPSVSLEAGIGPYYGLVTLLKVYEIPGVSQPLARAADAGIFSYHHLGLMADLRMRLKLDGGNEVSVGIHTTQDLVTFGAHKTIPIVPRFSFGGISIGFSRPIF